MAAEMTECNRFLPIAKLEKISKTKNASHHRDASGTKLVILVAYVDAAASFFPNIKARAMPAMINSMVP